MKSGVVIVCLALLALSVPSSTRADLIGYWPFDGDVNDVSGNGLNGDLIGDAMFDADTPGALGGGMSLQLNTIFVEIGGGSEDDIEAENNPGYVDLGNPDLLNFSTNDFTVSAWMKVPELLFQRGNIFSNGGDNGGGVRYVLAYLENGGQAIVLTTDDDSNKRQAQADLGGFPVDDGEWHHVVGLRQGNTLQVYIDGEFAAENADVPDGYDLSGTSQQPAFIGVGVDAGSGAFEKYYQGWLDDVAVWNEALSEDDINAVMGGDFSKWLGGGLLGDYNGNDVLDAGDLDLQAEKIGTNDPEFDLNGDGQVTYDDRVFWVEDASVKNSYIGDADLNGEFNSGDFVQVFTAGKYESGDAATWSEGDWTGDGLFNSGDFVAAFTSGGYELGPKNAVASVPEPASIVMTLLGIIGLLTLRRR